MSDTTSSPLAIVERYLRAIEAKDVDAVRALVHEDASQHEYPNQLVVAGAVRDRDGLLAGLATGAKVLRAERYEIDDSLVDGARVACRVSWMGELAVPVLDKHAGETLRAKFGVFFTLRDGRIVEQHNYDCFLP